MNSISWINPGHQLLLVHSIFASKSQILLQIFFFLFWSKIYKRKIWNENLRKPPLRFFVLTWFPSVFNIITQNWIYNLSEFKRRTGNKKTRTKKNLASRFLQKSIFLMQFGMEKLIFCLILNFLISVYSKLYIFIGIHYSCKQSKQCGTLYF